MAKRRIRFTYQPTAEQFMLIEHMAGQIEKIQEQLEAGMHNKVNIEFLSKQARKVIKAM